MAQSSAFDSMHPAGKLPPTLTPTGHFAGKPTLPISRSVTLIGARKQARLQLISSTVSQSHALIVNADSGPYIRDLASREHVFVNGIQVREGQLADGDEIQIGRFTFRFNESPTTQPVEAIRNIPNAPSSSLELDGADAPMPIESKSILIGRRDTCDVPLLEDTASTTHAIIFEMDGHRYLRDLASRTGTFVNGRQVHQIELSPGDEIKIGQTTIRYQAEATPARDVMPSRLPPANLGAIGDDVVPLDEAPRKMPVPQPRATPARAVPPPPPLVAPAGTESLELVQDQPAETEEVELTPEDLEVAPIEVEQDLLTPIESESPAEDEVELEPLGLARDEPVEIESPEPEPLPVRRSANESADLSDLVPAGEETEQAEVELEPLEVAQDEPIEIESDQPLEVEAEPVAEAPVEEATEELPEEATPVEEVAVEEAAVDDEVSLEPIAEVEPEPVADEHDLDIEPVATAEPEAEPEAEADESALAPEEPATEPVATDASADEPAAEEEPAPGEEVLTSESIDELLLLTPSTNPAVPVVQSKFAPGTSQLDLEPVTEIDAPAPSSDMLSLEPAARAPQPIVQPAAAKPVEAKVKDDLFRAPPIAPAVPRPQPVAPAPIPTPPRAPAPPPKVAAEVKPPPPPPPAPLPIEVEQIRFDTPEIAGFENGIGKSPRLSELAFDESALPELDMPTGAGDLNFDSPDLATSLDFTALDGDAMSEGAFAPVGEADIDIPSLDLGSTEFEAIPGLESPSPFGEAPDVTFDLDTGGETGKPMADTIVGAETPVFSAPAVEEPPRPKAKAPAKPVTPVRKAPKATKPKPVVPRPAPTPPPAPVLKAPPAPVAEAPPAAPVEPTPAPALDLSFPPASEPLAPQRPEPALPLEAPEAEILPATESTPESALAFDDAVSSAPPEAPAIGEPKSVELTDSSFGRAVESFVGEGTGPIVEEPIAPQAEVAPPVPVEPEIELEPTPEPAPLPSDDAPEPILPVAKAPPPVEVEPIEPDKLFDLEPIDVAQEKPLAPAKPQAELEIELQPVAEVEPPPVEAPSARPVEIAPQPIEVEAIEVEPEPVEVEALDVALDPVDLETLEPAAAAPEPLPESPLDEPPVAAGATEDALEEWGLDVEPVPAPPAAPQRPAPQPVAQAPTPPAAPPTSPSSGNMLWGADQDHFLGGRPLPLGGVAPPPQARQRPAPPPQPAHEQPAAPIGLTTPIPSIPTPPRNLPRPQRAKPDQVGTAFDGLALPVREADVFGNFNTGLTGALGAGAGMSEDIFGRRMTGPTPQPQIPASQPGQPTGQPPAPKRPVPRRATKSEATGDSWTPPTAQPAPHAPPAHEIADVEPQEIESVEIEPEELPPAVPPPRKKRRWFGLRSLLFLMLLCMSVAGVLIYYTPIVPNHSSVAGDLAFANHDKVPRIELSRLESEQKQQLNELRTAARSKLLATSANNASASFLDDQVGYLRTVSLAKMDLEKGVFTVTRPAASPGDQAAMLALLQALYDANGKLVAESTDLSRTVESLSRGRGEEEARIAALKQEIDRLGVTAQSAPSDAERAKLEAQAAQLQSDASSAQLISTRLGDALKQLQQDSSSAAPTEPQAAASDAVLTQLEGQMKELNERINAVQEGRSEKSRAARDQLDSAIAAFNQQIEQAQGAVKDNPQLLAYVNNAQKLMTSSRELTDQLIKRQQDQYAKLSELKTGLNDKMLARRAEVWKKDPELLKLMDQKDIKSRRLNVAQEQGLTKEADDIKAELNLIESMIQARQTVVADDGFYADAIDQIQKIIDATQRGLEDDRKLTMQKLDEMQASLAKDQPQLATLTPEQKQLAEEMEKRLADLSAARRQYTENSDAANRQADEEMRSLQANASELTSKFQARKQELGAAGAAPIPATVDPAVLADARKKALEQKTAEFTAAEKVRTEAETALLAVNKQLLELKTRAEQAAKAGQDRDQKIRQRDREQQELDQRINQYEMKKKLADQKAYPIAPTQASVRYDRKDDLRPYALLGVAALIIGVFVATIMLTDIRHGGASPEQPELPDAYSLDAPSGHQLPAPSHRAERHTHVEV